MPTTWKDIENVVLEVVRATCDEYELRSPMLDGNVCPLRDVGGLDSLHCVEMIVAIAARVPMETDNNVFWTDSGSRRTIQQVAKHLVTKQRSP